MICTSCGYENSEDAKFCSGCGMELKAAENVEVIEETAAAEENTEQEEAQSDAVTVEENQETDSATAPEGSKEADTAAAPEENKKADVVIAPEENKKADAVTAPRENQEADVATAPKREQEKKIPEKKMQERTSRPSKVKGFGRIKFSLGFLTILFTLLSGATLLIDMFIVRHDVGHGNANEYYEYIKGTDIFKMINHFGDLSGPVKTFVIASVAVMILVIGIALVQFFVTLLWRTKGGYICMIFTSIIAIAAEGIMIGLFLQNYVMDLYNAVGFAGYGPVIAIALHVCIIIIANVTIKLTKINAIVNH